MVGLREEVQHLAAGETIALAGEQTRVARERDRIARHEHQHRCTRGGEHADRGLAEAGPCGIRDHEPRGLCRPAFERQIGYRPSLGRRLTRAYVSTATTSYLATVGLLTGFFLALPLLDASESGMRLGWLIALGLVAAIPASDLAIALVNRAVSGKVTGRGTGSPDRLLQVNRP